MLLVYLAVFLTAFAIISSFMFKNDSERSSIKSNSNIPKKIKQESKGKIEKIPVAHFLGYSGPNEKFLLFSNQNNKEILLSYDSESLPELGILNQYDTFHVTYYVNPKGNTKGIIRTIEKKDL